MSTAAAALFAACLLACLGGANAAALEFRRCESVEFIIAADGLARRVAERGLVGRAFDLCSAQPDCSRII